MSQQELAGRIDLSPSYLSLVEAGKKEPSMPMLREIASGLGVSLDMLMLTAIDYGELRRQESEVTELFSQLLLALVSTDPR